jgi:glycosyltransferase involved in cell wall biosynthesis
VDKSNLKVLYVSKHNPTSAQNWSGTPHFIYDRISNSYDNTEFFIPNSMGWFRFGAKVVKKIFSMLGNSSIDLTRTEFYARKIGQEVRAKVSEVKPDVVVGVAASIELAYVDTDVPFIHISDATFLAMLDYYPEFSAMGSTLKAQGQKIESRTISNAAAAIYSSDWARKSALNDYHATPEKVHTLPLGANVRGLPDITEDHLAQKFSGQCKLLFIGKEWGRKGGDIVLKTFNILRLKGLDVHLTIIGVNPPGFQSTEAVTVIESLNKDVPAELETFNREFLAASFFFLPTQAEAYGLVYAEAAAFGAISVGPNTGGVPTVVQDGVTGILLPSDANCESYADKIMECWADKDRLATMSKAARTRFHEELSWDRWQSDFEDVVAKVVSQNSKIASNSSS